MHPALQRNKVLRSFINTKIKNGFSKNKIIFSKKTIKEDIKLSTHFLYTCSTAALECLAAGLTPIHYNEKGYINSLQGYKIPNEFEAYSPDDIKKILELKISMKYIRKFLKYHKYSFDVDFINKHSNF